MITTKKKSGLTVEQAKQILQTDIDRRKRNIKGMLISVYMLLGFATIGTIGMIIILNS
mgnify:FL=1